MKDEEMAEEHIKDKICKDCADEGFCGGVCVQIKYEKQGYLAGLKAGRPQVHKVTDWKDNSQFPKDELKTYVVRLYQDHYVICELNITEGHGQFYLSDNLEYIDPQDVMEWCELSMFEVEK